MSDIVAKRKLVAELAADLAAETSDLLRVLAKADWDAATPAQGWSVRDQVTHLAFFDDAVVLSLRDPAGFARQRAEQAALGGNVPDLLAERYRHLPGPEILDWLTRSREALVAAYREADPAARLPWYGPDMSVPSSITARIMETWAHGQDIRDTAGVATPVTRRLRHIANLGVRTFGFCFAQRGLPVPGDPVRVRLHGPSGDLWEWTAGGGAGGAAEASTGADGVANSVTGNALDFCLVVTQRRNVADTGLAVRGGTAERWIAIAQAFAGGPTDPPPAGTRTGPASVRAAYGAHLNREGGQQ
ncbi:MAG TPA: TIGR03084 family metal-binding protein [Trebonia sp.]|nr:TIGR03084 family metal-binding protein [Trebonia sp.]